MQEKIPEITEHQSWNDWKTSGVDEISQVDVFDATRREKIPYGSPTDRVPIKVTHKIIDLTQFGV